MAAYVNDSLNGYAVARKDMELFEDLCREWDIDYRFLAVLKNMVTVDMKSADYLRVETEILSRSRRA
jgi:uncharacterized protein YjaG (DUF416 family)